jgi:NAD(P)-dependent dehydrogenase (short-subunit alcohol dehydrogenase family)
MILNGKTVLIAGGRRLGAKLALDLAARGANIALSYHSSRDAMLKLVDQCEQAGVQAEAFPADLRHPDDVNSLIEETIQRFQTLDVLINMTSIYSKTPFDSLHPNDYHELIASNLTAPYFTAVAAARAMRRQPPENGLQGKIIQFADWAVDRPYRDYLPYLVAKGGLVTLTKALAVELSPTITVNAIAPGTIEPPPDASYEQLERIRLSSALQRTGTHSDINGAVLYLLEGTDFVTGEVFRIDGGRFLGATTGGA